MVRLIDAEALKELVASNVYPVADAFNSRDYGMFWTGGIEKAIDEMPSIDAVPVVRCRNCKHYKPSDVAKRRMCFRKDDDGMPVCYDFLPDDWCKYGEMK